MSDFLIAVVSGLWWLLCLAAVAGPLIWLIVWSRRMRRRAVAANHAWARAHSFHYWPWDRTATLLSARAPFGSDRSAQDVFRGRHRGAHMHCFQLQYTTGGGDDRRTQYYQVVAISTPASRPFLEVGHETFLTRHLMQDIDFENQAFNDRFLVRAENRRFAFDVVHARMMEWMLADPRAHAYTWRFEGQWLMTYRTGPLKREELFWYADFLHDVLAQVPAHVWAD